MFGLSFCSVFAGFGLQSAWRLRASRPWEWALASREHSGTRHHAVVQGSAEVRFGSNYPRRHAREGSVSRSASRAIGVSMAEVRFELTIFGLWARRGRPLLYSAPSGGTGSAPHSLVVGRVTARVREFAVSVVRVDPERAIRFSRGMHCRSKWIQCHRAPPAYFARSMQRSAATVRYRMRKSPRTPAPAGRRDRMRLQSSRYRSRPAQDGASQVPTVTAPRRTPPQRAAPWSPGRAMPPRRRRTLGSIA